MEMVKEKETLELNGYMDSDEFNKICEKINDQLELSGRDALQEGRDIVFSESQSEGKISFNNEHTQCSAYEVLSACAEFLRENIGEREWLADGDFYTFEMNNQDGQKHGIISPNGTKLVDQNELEKYEQDIDRVFDVMIEKEVDEAYNALEKKYLEPKLSVFQVYGKTSADLSELKEALGDCVKTENLDISLKDGFFRIEACDITGFEAADIAYRLDNMAYEKNEDYFAYGNNGPKDWDYQSFAYVISKESNLYDMYEWDQHEVEDGSLVDAFCEERRNYNIPSNFEQNEGFWLTVLEKNAERYQDLPYEFENDENFVKAAFEVNPMVFGYMDDAFKTKEMTEKAVAFDLENVNYAPPEFTTKEMLKEAMQKQKLDLGMIPDNFRLKNFTPERADDFDKILEIIEKVAADVSEIIEPEKEKLVAWFDKAKDALINFDIQSAVKLDLETKSLEYCTGSQVPEQDSTNMIFKVRTGRDANGFIEEMQERITNCLEAKEGEKLAMQRENEQSLSQNKARCASR